MPFGDELRNVLTFSHSNDFMATFYKQVIGLVASRTDGRVGVAFVLQRTRHLLGEIRLTSASCFEGIMVPCWGCWAGHG